MPKDFVNAGAEESDVPPRSFVLIFGQIWQIWHIHDAQQMAIICFLLPAFQILAKRAFVLSVHRLFD